jgi:hypothetical protein
MKDKRSHVNDSLNHVSLCTRKLDPLRCPGRYTVGILLGPESLLQTARVAGNLAPIGVSSSLHRHLYLRNSHRI